MNTRLAQELEEEDVNLSRAGQAFAAIVAALVLLLLARYLWRKASAGPGADASDF